MLSCSRSSPLGQEKERTWANSMHLEIRIAGFGGQGIIRTGLILAAASCIHGNRNATQTASYGPESRGGKCRSEVIISDEEIDFPKVEHPDILVAMSQEAFTEYSRDLKENGILIIDPDLVPDHNLKSRARTYEVPATKIAERLGTRIVANVVMIGAFAAISDIIEKELLIKSVERNVPKALRKTNIAAFEEGYKYGADLVGS